MRIAYSIMCHKNINQVIRLVNSLFDTDNLFFIHVDLSAKDVFQGLTSAFSSFPNIHFIPSKRAVWACWSLVEIQIDLMAYSLNYSYDYLINLSGQDFPIRSQAYIKSFLSQSNTNFLTARHAESDFDYKQVWKYTEDTGELKVNDIPRPLMRDVIPDIPFSVGSQWFILKREVCDHIINFSRASEIQEYMRYILIPDESYFQTIFLVSPFVNDFQNTNLRYGFLDRYSNTIFSSPRVLLTDDFAHMMSTDNVNLFARKFDIAVDAHILTLLESKVL